MNKKQLSVLLSSLSLPTTSHAHLEQYSTPGELAADMVWRAFMAGDIQGKVVADLGCGSGILGLGALVLGASKVIFVDVDDLALPKKNLQFIEEKLGTSYSCVFLHQDVKDFTDEVDCVIQNPPFGVQDEHADRSFLLAGLQAPVAYSLHKIKTKNFIETFVAHHGKQAVLLTTYSFPLKKSMDFHTKPVRYVSVGLWRLFA
jgi:putative methylase